MLVIHELKMKRLYKYIAPITLVAVLFAFLVPQFAQADITTGLVAYYTFDDGSGTTAADSAGTNTGTLSGSTIPTWVGGKIGAHALAFNGSTAYVNVPDATALNPTAITVSAWVNFTSFGSSYNAIVSKVTAGGGAYYQLFVKSNGTLAVYMTGSSGAIDYDGTGSHTLTLNTWYHIAFTYDSSTGLIGYVNGVQDATVGASGTLTAPTGVPLTISNDTNTAGRFAAASIDDVRIYNRAFTSSDITQLFNFTGITATVAPVVLIQGANVILKGGNMTIK